MSPAERAEAAGWQRHEDAVWRVCVWRNASGHTVAGSWLGCWQFYPLTWPFDGSSLVDYATEDEALAAALNAAGVP